MFCINYKKFLAKIFNFRVFQLQMTFGVGKTSWHIPLRFRAIENKVHLLLEPLDWLFVL